MRVLYFVETCPGLSASAIARVNALVAELATSFAEVGILGFASSDAEACQWQEWRDGQPGMAVFEPIFAGSPGRMQRLLAGLRWRLPSELPYVTEEAKAALRAAVEHFKPDVLHVMSFNVLRSALELPVAHRLLTPYDAYSLAALRSASVLSGWASARCILQAALYARNERAMYRQVDGLLPVSDVDALWLELLLNRSVETLPVPAHPATQAVGSLGMMGFSKETREASNRPVTVCISGTFHIPDVKVSTIEALPELARALSDLDVKVTVWGPSTWRQGGEHLSRLCRRYDFRYVDYVSDYWGFLAQQDVFVYPQRSGAGLQTKLQDALGLGLAAVGRPVSLVPLGATSGVDCIVASDVVGLANGVRSLVSSIALRAHISAGARDLILRRASKGNTLEALRRAYSP